MKKIFACTLSALGIFFLILDAKTAISGAKDGIQLCLYTVIPALFPFFVLSGTLCRNVTGISSSFLKPLGKLCRVPEGAESLLLLGFLGGYPVGAQNIRDALQTGMINKQQAMRMLGFCNNAGPAFIFGMAGSMFSKSYIPWVLWFIHIASALLVGMLLPTHNRTPSKFSMHSNGSLVKDLEKSLKAMAYVCGWVVFFRVILSFCKRWFFWLFPAEMQVLLTGMTELTNGVCTLGAISCEGMRFIICSAILSFGGLCVAMQTISVAGNLGTGYYFPGKVLQGLFSILLSYMLQMFLFSGSDVWRISSFWLLIPGILIALTTLAIYRFKNNSRKMTPSFV